MRPNETRLPLTGSAYAEGRAPSGALLESQSYGRKKLGFDRTTVAGFGRHPIGNGVVNEGNKVAGQPQRQARCAKTAHLLNALRVHALAGHRVRRILMRRRL